MRLILHFPACGSPSASFHHASDALATRLHDHYRPAEHRGCQSFVALGTGDGTDFRYAFRVRIRQTVLTRADGPSLAPLEALSPELVLVFAAPSFFEDGSLHSFLSTAFPGAALAGCSTAGEISSLGVREQSMVVTAVSFGHPAVQAATTPFAGAGDSEAAGRRLGEILREPRPGAVLVFGPGVDVNGSHLIAGLTEALGRDVPVSGGLAGDYGAFRRTWVLSNEGASDAAVVAVALSGDGISISHGSFGGWKSFGPARRATRTAGNLLYELDGQPALDVYKRYLGEYARDLPSSGLLFPFAVLRDDRSESGLIRSLLGIDEAKGSITLAGDIPADGYLRLMHASTDALVDGAEAAARAAREQAPRTATFDGRQSLGLLVSCVGRKLVMGDAVDEEVEAVGSVFGSFSVLAGFYSNGEIGPFHGSGECKLHNQTMSVTFVTER